MDILIVKPSSLGDIIHVFPALELLRRRYPEARTDWLVRPEFAEILAYSPLPVRRKILFERKKLARVRTFPGTFCRLVRELRRESYDLVIDFQGLFRSGFFAWSARRNGPVVGFDCPREKSARFFYGRRFAVPEKMHAIERSVMLANALLHTADPVPEYGWPVLSGFAGHAPVPDGKTAIAIVPGARWASKQFPETLFAEVIRRLREASPGRFVFRIIGSPGEREAERRIVELAGGGDDLVPLAGKTGLCEMAECMRTCGAVLCNDSGPMHAAAALRIPVVALFGPTRPDLTGPYGKHCRVVRAEGLACLGCMHRQCGKASPPSCHALSAERIAGMLLDAVSGRFLPENDLTGRGNGAIL